MKTAIATDTNSGIKPEMLQEPGLYLLPMPVLVIAIMKKELP